MNTFAHFEDKTVPPTRAAPEDCELSFSVADLNNVALRRVAAQSSLFSWENSPSKVIDGNRNSNYNYGGSCSSTAFNTNPWWRVDLLDLYRVTAVTITNRGDCCPKRLDGAEIRIGNSLENNGINNPRCVVIHHIPAGETYTFQCNEMEGQYVVVVIPGQNKILTLCEVEVFATVKPPAPKSKRTVVRMKIQSDADLTNQAVGDQLLQQLHVELVKQGVSDFQLRWRTQPDGQIFHHEEDEKEGGPTQTDNVALRRVAAQSSLFSWENSPSKVIDGNRNSNYNYGGSCSSTAFNTNPWWRVDLLDLYRVTAVTITNRGDCCPKRLDGAEIRIGNSLENNGINNPRCVVIHHIPAGETYTFQCNEMEGQYVVVVIPGQNKILTLCEVEVFATVKPPAPKSKRTVVRMKIQSDADLTNQAVGDQLLQQLHVELVKQGVSDFQLRWRTQPDGQIFHHEEDEKEGGPTQTDNVALRRVAAQSSLFSWENSPSKVIDGNRNSNYNYGGSCSSTAFNTNPWWRVDLLDLYRVTAVTITNRGDCCPKRLDGAEIRIGNSLENNGINNPRCVVIHHIPAGETYTFQCNEMEGQYVVVVIPGQNKILTLCEVEVFATVKPPAPKSKRTVVRMKIQSDADLTNQAVGDQLLQQLHVELVKQGVSDFQLRWRTQPDGQIFHHEEDEKEGGPTQTDNVALRRVAAQSSLFSWENSPSKVIDGNRNSNYNYGGSCSSTAFNTNPWWRVDLLDLYRVTAVTITNRGDCCPKRLDGAEIRIGNSLENNGINNPRCVVIHHIPAGETYTFQCNEMEGQYVVVVIPGQNKILTLCEVEVFATVKPPAY
ncbi:uncharacterized protein LOC110532922 [Oncorhynchus mykiss]|uniref:uncharacterized protein LOC110532922 n=1 Tax=Oncorhynchus mykiss TaxID=8022 RepID=UPI001877EC4E|nr:uncharacterized protein LOC110532922 [Oncorhynchus mykiss]